MISMFYHILAIILTIVIALYILLELKSTHDKIQRGVSNVQLFFDAVVDGACIGITIHLGISAIKALEEAAKGS